MILKAALFRRDQIYSTQKDPRDAFCTALVDPTHSISSSKILSLFLSLSLSLSKETKKKKIVLVVKWGGETQNKNKNF